MLLKDDDETRPGKDMVEDDTKLEDDERIEFHYGRSREEKEASEKEAHIYRPRILDWITNTSACGIGLLPTPFELITANIDRRVTLWLRDEGEHRLRRQSGQEDYYAALQAQVEVEAYRKEEERARRKVYLDLDLSPPEAMRRIVQSYALDMARHLIHYEVVKKREAAAEEAKRKAPEGGVPLDVPLKRGRGRPRKHPLPIPTKGAVK